MINFIQNKLREEYPKIYPIITTYGKNVNKKPK